MSNVVKSSNSVYALVGNIPATYHSADLRNFFSQFIETKGFECFHFRHRPESNLPESNSKDETVDSTSSTYGHRTCCVVQVQKSRLSELIKSYHRKHWLDKNGDLLALVCFISKVKTPESSQDVDQYKTRSEQKDIPPDREQFTEADLTNLPELRPPGVMPNGNVGTPTLMFMDFIRQCLLPPNIIKKLGLMFPKTRTNKKYGSVPFKYKGEIFEGGDEEEEIFSASGHALIFEQDDTIQSESTSTSPHISGQHDYNSESSAKPSDQVGQDSLRQKRKPNKRKGRDKETQLLMDENIEEKMIEFEKGENDSEEDADGCEEWERHEAMYDDPSNQERNKERLFEEEIELKWEKGGSGLVFYTDAQHWQAQEGDFDEQTADDYDVDMQGYYEEGAGDKDAQDFITLRQDKRRREGVEETDRYTSGIAKQSKSQQKTQQKVGSSKIGQFESFTKGFGRKIMERQGWTDGQGLGRSVKGISEALENDGQKPRDKTGFGFRGEKLHRKPGSVHRKVIISTVFDNQKDTDPVEPLLRSNEPYTLKYCDEITFTKSKDSITNARGNSNNNSSTD